MWADGLLVGSRSPTVVRRTVAGGQRRSSVLRRQRSQPHGREGAAVTGRRCARGPLGSRDASDDIRVLVVDDHPLVRMALAEMFDGEDDLTVVGECEDGSQVVE